MTQPSKRAPTTAGDMDRREVVRALEAVARHVDETADDASFFAALAATIAGLVQAERVTFALWNGTDALVRAPHGVEGQPENETRVDCRRDEVGWAQELLFNGGVLVGPLRGSREIDPYREVLQVLDASDGVAVAWRSGDSALGIVSAYNSLRPGGFVEPDVITMQVAAAAAGLVWRERIARTRAAEVLGQELVLRRRLEALVGGSEQLWRLGSHEAMADEIVRQASEIIPEAACSLTMVVPGRPDTVRIVAANAEWIEVGWEGPMGHTLVGRALMEQQPVESIDSQRQSAYADRLRSEGVNTVRAVPLISGESPGVGSGATGALAFLRRGAVPFAPDERAIMDEFGRRVTVAWRLAGLLEESHRTAKRLELGLEVAMDLASSLSPKEVINLLLQRAVEAVEADRATLSTVAEDQIVIEATFDRFGSPAWIGQAYSLDYVRSQPLVERAFATMEPVLGGQLEVEPAAPELQSDLSSVRHTATLPLVLAGRLAGLLVLSRRADRAFGPEDIATLQMMGNSAMLALRNARLFAESQAARDRADRIARTLRIGVEVGVDLAQQLNPREVVTRLLRHAVEAVEADRCTLTKIEQGELVVEDSYVRSGLPVPVGSRWPIGDHPVVSEAVATGQPRQESRDSSSFPQTEPMQGIQHLLTVPLVLGGEAIGVLGLSRRRGDRFDEDEVATIQQIGSVAVLALRNARLFEELQTASRYKSDFMNLAAHELRTPLTVINGYLSMLGDGSLGQVPAEITSVLDTLAVKAAELGRIVDSLLTAARLQASSLAGQAVLMDLRDAVAAALQRARPGAALLGARLDCELPDRGVPVHADPEHVGRILDNLINNALAYSPPPPWLQVKMLVEADLATVMVVDHGRGVPPEVADKIFEQFFRADDPDTPNPAGTGLGLYISRQLAEQYGGSLRLEASRPGKGSTFALRLPLAASEGQTSRVTG